MTRAARTLLALAALALPRLAAGEVRLCVPAFDGPGGIGLRVATVLNLQVFQTLRRAPYPNPEKLSFGDGKIIWSDAPLPAQSYDAAEAMARPLGCQAVLWGKAFPYGGGIVVQAHLAVLDLDAAQEAIWSVPASGGGKPLAIGLPRRRWDFASIVLDPAVVAEFSSPDALVIRSERVGGTRLGTLGPAFEAARHEGDDILLRAPIAGWVHLPRLSTARTEVVDFTGGVFRVLRGDWDGARDLFARVTSNDRAPTALRVDAHLLAAASAERRGRSGAAELARAEQLNPYSPDVARYRVMGDLAELSRLAPAAAAGGTAPAYATPLPPAEAAQRAARARELASRVDRTVAAMPGADPKWKEAAREEALRARERAER